MSPCGDGLPRADGPRRHLLRARALDAAHGRATISTQVTGPFAGAGSLNILNTRDGRAIRVIRMRGQSVAVSHDA